MSRHFCVKRGLLTFIAVIFAYSGCFALDPALKMNRFTTECFNSAGGLPQNTVADIFQDSDGYIHLATQEGAVKYDGKKFSPSDPALFEGSASRNVLKIISSVNGILYATSSGIVSKKAPSLPADTYVNDIITEKNGNIWVATYSSGIIRISTDGKQTLFDKANGRINSDVITDLAVDGKDRIFATTLEGLSYFNGEKFVPVDGVYAFSYRMTIDSSGWLWVATERGLALVKEMKLDYIYTKEDGLRSESLRSVYSDSKGSLWIGSEKGELIRFTNGKFSYLPSKTDLQLGAIISISEDREKNIWFGTEVTGACIVREGSVFQAGINSGNIRSITETSEGAIWAATFGEGIKILGKDETVTSLTSAQGLRNDSATSVFADRENRIWIGTRRSGVQVFQNGKLSDLDSLAKSFSEVNPVSPTLFFQDSRNNIWIADRHSNRPLFTWKDGVLRSFKIKEGEISVLDIAENRSGTLFIATMKDGLFTFDSVKEEFTPFEFRKDIKISSIFIDRADRLWVSTQSKGTFIKLENDIVELNESNGFYSNTVHDIVQDDSGSFWFSTNKGIFTVTENDLNEFLSGKKDRISIKVFREEDGMKAGECNGGSQPSILKASDGTVWFPTINGIVTIDPGKMTGTAGTPPVTLTGALLDNTKYIDLKPDSNFTVPAGTKSVEIFFTSLYFTRPDKVNFNYMLAGFDNEWNNGGNKRSVKYTNISPGNYMFSVRSYLSDTPEKFSESSVTLDYRPFFYQDFRFRALAGIILLLIILTAYHLKIRLHKLREKELQEVVRQRTEELVKTNEKLRESILKDPMTGLCNRRYLFEIEKPRYERMLFAAAKNAKDDDQGDFTPETKVTGLFLIDIGGLKKINEKKGYDFGDRLLTAFAETLRNSVRKDDLVVRWGGDEFLVLLNTTKYDHLPVYAKKIEEIAQKGIEITGEEPVKLSLSIGFSAMPFYSRGLNALNFEESLLMSDMALFKALSEGTAKIKQALPGNEIPAKEEIATFMKDIDSGIKKGFFRIEDI